MARERIVARSDEDRESFLRKRGFSKSETAKIVETVLSEEDTETSKASSISSGRHGARSQQDPSGHRLELEGKARKRLERAA